MTEHLIDEPDLRLTPGGWLAVATDEPKIAVVAPSEDEARQLFSERRAIWRRLLAARECDGVDHVANKDTEKETTSLAPLDPEDALRALLAVKPHEDVDWDDEADEGDAPTK